MLAVVLKVTLKDAQDSLESISQNPSQKSTGSPDETTKGYEELLA